MFSLFVKNSNEPKKLYAHFTLKNFSFKVKAVMDFWHTAIVLLQPNALKYKMFTFLKHFSRF